MLGYQQRRFGTHELLHAIEAHHRLLRKLFGGLGIVEQQTGGLHQSRTDLQTGVGWILLRHGTQRCIDFQSGPGIQAFFTTFADQGMGQSKVAFSILET
ncbi:hypothetical protein D3C85_768720 [compost metagenome]